MGTCVHAKGVEIETEEIEKEARSTNDQQMKRKEWGRRAKSSSQSRMSPQQTLFTARGARCQLP
jgi:hypothetical protein